MEAKKGILEWFSFFSFSFILLKISSYEREREREQAGRGAGEERESPADVPLSKEPNSPMQGQSPDPEIMT